MNGGGLTDAYVLQGGSPTGADYGDAIETCQSPGHFRFFEAAATPDASSTLALLGLASAGLAGLRRRMKV